MNGTDDDVVISSLDSPVGLISIVVTRNGLARIAWATSAQLGDESPEPVVAEPQRAAEVLAQLTEYFHGERRAFTVPLDWRYTTGHRRTVLRCLYQTVLHGEAITYGELAHRSGSGVAPRGIGSIMGSNPIPIVVPCHRVLARTSLGGYSGGRDGDRLDTKRWLLSHENVLPPTLDLGLDSWV